MERPDPVERPVLVFDFGSQFVQLIARRVRERHAFARIVRHDMPVGAGPCAEPAGLDPVGRTGERLRVGWRCAAIRDLRPGDPDPGERLRDEPGLRGARGHGSSHSGTRVRPGRLPRPFDPGEPLFHAVPSLTTVWMSHGDQVHDAGDAFVPLAATATCPIAAVRHQSGRSTASSFTPRLRIPLTAR